MLLPLMVSAKDGDLLGVANRSDAMGALAIWSVRARPLVPHLTEQTTDLRGFQILMEAFRLWQLYERNHSEHAERADDFFLLVEQAFARTVAWHDGEWPLPGTRRVLARLKERPHISLADPGWHLHDGRKANGVWGLYRGAAGRASLLTNNLSRLSNETSSAAEHSPGLNQPAQSRLFDPLFQAMDGASPELPTHMNDQLVRCLYQTFHQVPLAAHLRQQLIETNPLNRALAERLVAAQQLHHRRFIVSAIQDLPDHRTPLEDVLHCENLLAVVEAVFLWLCARKGNRISDIADRLPVDREALESARVKFGASGSYGSGTAAERQQRMFTELDTSTGEALARSVLSLHQDVSKEG